MNSLRMSFWIVPPSCFRRHALFLGGDDVERHDRQHRAVHGHRHRHLVERDAGEQRPHVVDRVDRDAGHADVAGDARMIGVVAAVGGEIEGDGEALLAGGEIAAVEGVGILRGGEAGVLPDGPGLGDVHGRVGAAQIGRDAGIAVEAGDAVEVVRAVGGLDRDAFGREPGLGAACRRARDRRGGEIDLGEIRNAAHGFIIPTLLQGCGTTARRGPVHVAEQCLAPGDGAFELLATVHLFAFHAEPPQSTIGRSRASRQISAITMNQATVTQRRPISHVTIATRSTPTNASGAEPDSAMQLRCDQQARATRCLAW